ncbi:hypothetical protein ACQR16_32935 [Bradyrhizobium oligotrophicum]|uniref:hypothetical protein n=1 Tax=Bradyrhizobium oligotrophicum TaxID=44255 RepID=UPI003EBB0FAA
MSQTIAAAGNTEVPAYLTLINLGYKVDRGRESDYEPWIAEIGTLKLVAHDLLQLVGLSLLYRERANDWHAADEEIEAFLARFS